MLCTVVRLFTLRVVHSTHDLTPLPISSANDPTSPVSASARLRGRVEQQVGELTNSATKVISGVGGVVDTSFTVLRGLLTPAASDSPTTMTPDESKFAATITRPGFGLLRRGTGFSIASVAASLPGASALPKRNGGHEGQQMLEVPR